jgi:hypothetical protein
MVYLPLGDSKKSLTFYVVLGFLNKNPNLNEERWFGNKYNSSPSDFAHNSRAGKVLMKDVFCLI